MKTENTETEIAGFSPNISEIDYKKFLEIIKNIKPNDIIVLSGSVPKSLDNKIYKEIIKLLPKNVKVVLDTRGEAYKFALEEKIYLIKPNHTELEEFFNKKYETIDEIIEAGEKLKNMGSENVIISLGEKGSILITDKGIWIGNTPKGKLISSVGAGDSMIAGFLYGINNEMEILEAYKYGIASGSATAFTKNLATFEQMKNLLNEIEIIKK